VKHDHTQRRKHRYNIPYLHGGSIWDSDSASRLNRSSQLIQGLGEFFGGDAMFAYQTGHAEKKANYLNPPNKNHCISAARMNLPK